MTPQPNPPAPAWTIIIPVKNTAVAKTRLSGYDQPTRAMLALAFALDSATAALGCPVVRRVVAVTSDHAASRALADIGVEIVPDLPDAGLNAALVHGARVVRRREPSAAVAAMSGDLPALRSDVLTLAIAAAAGLPSWFVADAEGVGTTMLAAGPGARLSPAFGVDSRARHRDLGAVDLAAGGLGRLRRDVDLADHLREAVRLGVGSHTTAALAEIHAAASACHVT